MARRMLGEIFEEIQKKVKHVDKIAVLQKYADSAVGYVLKLAYSDVAWELPDDAPPYKQWKGRPGSSPSDLMRELRRLYIFIKGQEPGLTKFKRERLFQQVLEGLEKAEAELLIAIKDKRFEKTYRLPRKVVEDAFPGLFDQPFNPRFIR